jgi:hypothetical protein
LTVANSSGRAGCSASVADFHLFWGHGECSFLLGSEINVRLGRGGNNDRHEANLYLRLRVLPLPREILRVDLI